MPPKKILKPGPGQLKLTFASHKTGNNVPPPSPTIHDSDSQSETEAQCSQGQKEGVAVGEPDADECSSSKRKFHNKWCKIWPWLYVKDDKMYCRLCVVGGKSNAFTIGCNVFRTSSMSRHEMTADHNSCIESSALKNDMTLAVKKAHEGEDKAIVKALKSVHWLVMENLPLSKYESMMTFMKNLEVPGLEILALSDHVSYQSYYTANEMLQALSCYVDDDINSKIKNSPFISILADESTDISNTQRMTVTARIVDPKTAKSCSVFLQDLEYDEGTGAGLANEILKQLHDRNIPISKVLGLGTDGASVMTGLGKGVHGRLMELNPHIVNIHCMAHRLALCTSQAANGVPMLKKYQEWLTQLFYYFKNSALREKQLHKIQEILEHPTLKYREIHSVRWLSFFEALQAVYRTIDPLLTYLHNRQADKDPKAKGLLKYMASRQFLFVTYLMMDVIPLVSKLCLTLQSETLDVAKAKVAIDLCLTDLEAYKSSTMHFKTHLEDFDSMEKVGDHYEYSGHRLQDTNTNFGALKSQFVNKLVQNIKDRFPKKGLLDAFYVLAMRTINFEKDILQYGVEELNTLLTYYGEEQAHKGHTSPPLLNKDQVRFEWQEAKVIVHSAKYPVDDMTNLWNLLVTHHYESLKELLKLVQIAQILPLHTAGCERVFSQQNLIVTKQRNRLSPVLCDRLLRVKLEGQHINFESVLRKFHELKNRRIKTNISS